MMRFLFSTLSISFLLLLSGCSGSDALLSASEGAEEQKSDDIYFVEKDIASLKASSSKEKEQVSDKGSDYYDPEVAESLRLERLRNRNNGVYDTKEWGYSGDGWNEDHRFRFMSAFGTPISPEDLNTGRYWYYIRHLRQQNASSCPPEGMPDSSDDDEGRRSYEHGSGGDAPGVDFGTDGDPGNSSGENNSGSSGGRRSSGGNDGGSDAVRRR